MKRWWEDVKWTPEEIAICDAWAEQIRKLEDERVTQLVLKELKKEEHMSEDTEQFRQLLFPFVLYDEPPTCSACKASFITGQVNRPRGAHESNLEEWDPQF